VWTLEGSGKLIGSYIYEPVFVPDYWSSRHEITSMTCGLLALLTICSCAPKAEAQGQHGPPPATGQYFCDNNATITLQPLQ
jgi:hypothetical protein